MIPCLTLFILSWDNLRSQDSCHKISTLLRNDSRRSHPHTLTHLFRRICTMRVQCTVISDFVFLAMMVFLADETRRYRGDFRGHGLSHQDDRLKIVWINDVILNWTLMDWNKNGTLYRQIVYSPVDRESYRWRGRKIGRLFKSWSIAEFGDSRIVTILIQAVNFSVNGSLRIRARNEAKLRRGASLRFVWDEAKRGEAGFQKLGRSEARRGGS